MKKFTEAQLLVLRSLPGPRDDGKFPCGPEVMVCERLEAMGLAEGFLEPAEFDNRRGVTRYLRAYRRTRAGGIVVKRCLAGK